MSGLREAFDEIVADVPVYGDLDRAIARAERERRRRNRVVAGLAAAAAVGAVIIGMLAVARDTDTAPPISPSPSPTPSKTQSPQTWVDATMTPVEGVGWLVPNPVDALRDGWFQIVADHLNPSPRHAEWTSELPGEGFELPGEGSPFSTGGTIGVMDADGAEGLLADGCAYLHPISGDHRNESCRTEQIVGPNGERVHVTSFQSLCTTWDAESAAPGVFYKNCGDYDVTVVAERGDGRIGYVDVQGRDYVEAMPFALTDVAAAAADPRLTLPDAAYDLPSDQTVASVVADHFPTWREHTDVQRIPLREPGRAFAYGKLAPFNLSVEVRLAGGDPVCGRSSLVECVERRRFGADDPATVFVGAWDIHEWADSRVFTREIVYVGPHHTVTVSVGRIVKEHADGIGAELDQRVIDLVLDPRLQ